MSAIATSGLPCMAAVTAAREARIFHCTAARRTPASADAGVRLAAVQWKIRASRAAVTAAMQGNPDVAMADMWILCRRMNASFAARPDSLLFGAQSPVARAAAARDRKSTRLNSSHWS